MCLDSLYLFNSNCIHGYPFHEDFESRRLIKYNSVVSDIAFAKSKKVVYQIRIALTIFLSRKDLFCSAANVLKRFFKQCTKFRLLSILGHREFHCVHERTNRIFLISFHCFLQENIEIRSEGLS